jgi:(p)ppGpp synthase/HD superfamily hydrolase
MINWTQRLDKAVRVAARAHERQGQHRKGTDIPYIVHPFGVMVIAANVTDDEDVLVACLLHDILEDVSPEIYSEQNMRQEFGERVLAMVKDVSKDEAIADWHERCAAYLENLENRASEQSLIVSAADKIHNLRSMIIDYREVGDMLWQRFSTGSSKDQLWWYESVLKVIEKRLPGSAIGSGLAADLIKFKKLLPSHS